MPVSGRVVAMSVISKSDGYAVVDGRSRTAMSRREENRIAGALVCFSSS